MAGKAKNMYVSEADQASIDKLMALLDAEGVDIKNQFGAFSESQLFRYLVQQELARQQAQEHET